MKISPTPFAALTAALLLWVPTLTAAPGQQFPPLTPATIAKIQAAVPSAATAKPARPRKLLVFYRTEGFVHKSIPNGIEAIRAIGKQTGAFEAVASEDMAMFTPEKLADFDGILFLSTTGLKFPEPGQRKALLDFVASGRGLIGIHAATDNFPGWPEAQALMGGVFHGHPWVAGDVSAVKLDDPQHPLNRAFNGQGFWIRDELYQIDGPYGRDRQRVLLSLDMSKPQNQRPPEKIFRTDNDFPIAWIKKTPGGGRVFYSSLGHNEDVFETPEILRHYLDGIQFALGDLRADAVPSAVLGEKLRPALAPATPEPIQQRLQLSDLPALVKQVATYDFGRSRDAIDAVTKLIIASNATDREKIGAALRPLLADPAVPIGAKNQICRWIPLLGSPASIPALTRLIPDPDLGNMAIYALFEMSSTGARKALRAALSDSPAAVKPAIIGSLGRLRDEAAVPSLKSLASSSDLPVAKAALIALGAIASAESLTALQSAKVADTLQPAKNWALLAVAATRANSKAARSVLRELAAPANPPPLRVAAVLALLATGSDDGVDRAIAMITESPLDPGQKAALTRALPDSAVAPLLAKTSTLPPETQAIILRALFPRPAKLILAHLQAALKSPDPAVQLAAIDGLVALGSGRDWPALLVLAAGKSGTAASTALASLPGIDAELREHLKSAPTPIRVLLLGVLANRIDRSSLALALAAANDPDAAIRTAGIKAAGQLATAQELPAVLGLLKLAQGPAELAAAEKAIVLVARSAPEPDAVTQALKDAATTTPPNGQRALLLALAAQDTPKSGEALRQILAIRTGEARLEIIRILAGAQNPTAAGILLERARLAETAPERILSLRGWLDFAPKNLGDRNPVLRAYQRAWPLTERAEDRDAIVAALTKMRGGEPPALLKKLAPLPLAESLRLTPDAAVLNGGNVTLDAPAAALRWNGGATPDFDNAFWTIKPAAPGIYRLEVLPAGEAPADYRIVAAGKSLPITATKDGPIAVGELSLDGDSAVVLRVEPASANAKPLALKQITLTRVTPTPSPTAKPAQP